MHETGSRSVLSRHPIAFRFLLIAILAVAVFAAQGLLPSETQAGVTYVNRAAGATTGAWPNIQSFGGWKGSGTSGAGGGGPWYLRQYLREQSRTLIR